MVDIEAGICGEYEKCAICPRNCKADRNQGKLGVCRVSDKLLVARAALHYWEEPCISGEKGSGAVFSRAVPLIVSFARMEKFPEDR